MHLIYSENTSSNLKAEKLNQLFKGEISAVHSYTRVLKTTELGEGQGQFIAALQCHQCRADRLAGEIRRLGWQTARPSTFWASFAKPTNGGDPAPEQKAAVNSLAEAEDDLLNTYNILARDNDFDVQLLVKELYPKQQNSHHQIIDLKHRLRASAA